jgi:GNAT superfamily N-acetyltransferase
MTIRMATAADAPEIARLNTAFNGPGTSAAEIAVQMERCAGIETLYLAEVAGRAVGYACLRLVPTICSTELWAELTELYVEEEYRRLGVGRALIEQAEAAARAQQVSDFFLLTGFKNTNAHHFYHRVGYSMRCFTMHKTLEP